MDTVSVTLGKKTYQLKPCFEAIIAIEEKLQNHNGIIDLMNNIQDRRDFRFKEIAIVIHTALVTCYPEEKVSVDQVGNMMIEGGFMSYIPPVAKLLAGAIFAGPEDPLPDDGADKSDSEPKENPVG